MGHFAKILDGVVQKVIVAEPEFFETFVDESPGTWIQTSYNTRFGDHTLGGTPLRKNYAGVGYTYDSVRDAFIPQKPFPSWMLNETTCVYDPPTARPTGLNWEWNETAQEWQQS